MHVSRALLPPAFLLLLSLHQAERFTCILQQDPCHYRSMAHPSLISGLIQLGFCPRCYNLQRRNIGSSWFNGTLKKLMQMNYSLSAFQHDFFKQNLGKLRNIKRKNKIIYLHLPKLEKRKNDITYQHLSTREKSTTHLFIYGSTVIKDNFKEKRKGRKEGRKEGRQIDI